MRGCVGVDGVARKVADVGRVIPDAPALCLAGSYHQTRQGIILRIQDADVPRARVTALHLRGERMHGTDHGVAAMGRKISQRVVVWAIQTCQSLLFFNGIHMAVRRDDRPVRDPHHKCWVMLAAIGINHKPGKVG